MGGHLGRLGLGPLELLSPLSHERDQRILLVNRQGVGLLAQFELGDLLTDRFRPNALPGGERKTHLPHPDDRFLHLLARGLPSVPKLRDPSSERVVLFVEPLDLVLGGLAAVVDRLLLGRNPSDLRDQLLPTVEERAKLRVDRPKLLAFLAVFAFFLVGGQGPRRHGAPRCRGSQKPFSHWEGGTTK